MNNLENFQVNEGAEGIDNGAFERLKEKMAQSGAQIKRDQKQEASQAKKDDILFNVLIEFIKHFPADHPVVKGIVGCLSANIPSLVVLSVISLNYKSIDKAIPKNEHKHELTFSSSDIPQINKLIDWLAKLTSTLSSIKNSDIPKVYPSQKLAIPLLGLINHTLTEYFKSIPDQEVPVDKVEPYISSILQKLSFETITPSLDQPSDNS
jgi:hypothetical protein